MKKSFLNKEVRVDFLDHAENSTEPIPCVVYGRVIKDAPAYFIIACWTFCDGHTLDADEVLANQHSYTILKSTIKPNGINEIITYKKHAVGRKSA